MFSFFRRSPRRESSRRPIEMVPCPHCGAEVPVNAAACRHCGYDWDADPYDDESASDDFDYDEYVEREFGSDSLGPAATSTTLSPWQRAVAVLLIIAFALALFGPLLF